MPSSVSQKVAKLHCPGCGVALRVPPQAAGIRARCPACRATFRIPRRTDLMEETISVWIEEDVDRLAQEHEKHLLEEEAERLRRQEQSAAKPKRSAAPRSVGATPPTPPAPQPVASELSKPLPTMEVAEPSPHVLERFAAAAASPSPAPPAAPAPTPAPMFHGRPRLEVIQCTSEGVLLAFDAIWLEHEGFRCSMPVRCVFSGEDDRAELLARPLAFIDQSSGQFRSPRELENKLEQHLPQGLLVRDFVRKLPNLQGMARPFNHVVPYYVMPRLAKLSLHCRSRRREDGGHTCMVMIPDGRYALDWLGRINSVTGEDYAQLEQEIVSLQGETWRLLPQEVRARIGVWCHFRPRERFVLYLPDTDFAKSDAGLAGLVLTDQRLVFHKFHHTGEHPMALEALVLAKPEGRGVTLSLQSEDRHTRMCNIAPEDLPHFAQTLAAFPAMRLQNE